MVNPVENVSIYAHSFGGELVVSWTMPTIIPESFKIIIFKRSQTDVTQAEIDDYFATGTIAKGLFVADAEDSYLYNQFIDLRVLNEITHYYKIVLLDKVSKEYSTAVGVSGIAQPDIKVNVVDGKEVVKTALEKLFDNIYTPSKKLSIGRDIEIVKAFGVQSVTSEIIMLERVNSADYQRYWGNAYAPTATGQIQGKMLNDIIRATFLTNNLERREKFANIIRANVLVLEKFCNLLSGKSAFTEIVIEGDYYNPVIHGENAVGFTIIFNLKTSVYTQISIDEINRIIINDPEIKGA